jgi:hypothetical protein
MRFEHSRSATFSPAKKEKILSRLIERENLARKPGSSKLGTSQASLPEPISHGANSVCHGIGALLLLNGKHPEGHREIKYCTCFITASQGHAQQIGAVCTSAAHPLCQILHD